MINSKKKHGFTTKTNNLLYLSRDILGSYFSKYILEQTDLSRFGEILVFHDALNSKFMHYIKDCIPITNMFIEIINDFWDDFFGVLELRYIPEELEEVEYKDIPTNKFLTEDRAMELIETMEKVEK